MKAYAGRNANQGKSCQQFRNDYSIQLPYHNPSNLKMVMPTRKIALLTTSVNIHCGTSLTIDVVAGG